MSEHICPVAAHLVRRFPNEPLLLEVTYIIQKGSQGTRVVARIGGLGKDRATVSSNMKELGHKTNKRIRDVSESSRTVIIVTVSVK
jgi:hypothetical protein